MSAWPANGTVTKVRPTPVTAAALSVPSTGASPPRTSRARDAASAPRSSARDPMTTFSPALASRSANPNPRSPVPPTIAIVIGGEDTPASLEEGLNRADAGRQALGQQPGQRAVDGRGQLRLLDLHPLQGVAREAVQGRLGLGDHRGRPARPQVHGQLPGNGARVDGPHP